MRFDYLLLTEPGKANLPRSERSGYLEEWTAGTGIKEISELIRLEQQKNPNEKIVVGTEGYFGTLPDGLQIYLNDLRQITVIGVGLNFDKLPNSLLESQKAGNLTYFLVNNSRFNGDKDNKNLQLVAVYPKAIKPDGTNDYMLFYEFKQ